MNEAQDLLDEAWDTFHKLYIEKPEPEPEPQLNSEFFCKCGGVKVRTVSERFSGSRLRRFTSENAGPIPSRPHGVHDLRRG